MVKSVSTSVKANVNGLPDVEVTIFYKGNENEDNLRSFISNLRLEEAISFCEMKNWKLITKR